MSGAKRNNNSCKLIRIGEDGDKPALREMWKLCFPDDTDAFIDFYFDKVYKNEETLVYLEDNQPVASLQMVPYSIQTETAISLAGYISGAMTHPDFRKKGYMAQLLNASFEVMKEKGYDYTFLIPQEAGLVDFYKKYGYEKIRGTANGDRQPATGKRSPVTGCPSPFPLRPSPFALYPKYCRLLMASLPVALKTEQQFSVLLQDFFDEKGVLFANDEGIAFTLQKEDKIIIKEFLCPDEETKELFLTDIRQYYRLNQVILPEEYKGMIKKLTPAADDIWDVYLGMMMD
jgi:GNAT superfamily N-acetyltransferase